VQETPVCVPKRFVFSFFQRSSDELGAAKVIAYPAEYFPLDGQAGS
jgi:hypothetical protein